MRQANRKTVAISLLISILLASSAFVKPSFSQPTTLFINPPETKVNVCSEFTVEVRIREVIDLYMWDLRVFFNPLQIQYVSATEGPFLRMHGPTVFATDPQPDNLHMGCSLLIPPGVSGDGILAYITFHCISPGVSQLHFSDTMLYDSNQLPITHTAIDGTVTQLHQMYWKENFTDYAPSGMPDFDQKQDAWQ
ncbi:hypothetical protein KEJ15_05415, partial [Candidatus Bathyarchaeota archaeon]|nr:hypothetical protein [Candidatus Bathyarchaeota archaeon]